MRVAFVFDLDGTLIESRWTIAAACNHALVTVGRTPLPEDEIAGYVGDGARNLIARALRSDPRAPEVEATLTEFLRHYAAHPIAGTTWMSGAEEALHSIHASKVTLVTNKSRTVTIPILRALGIEARFGAIVAGGDGPLKPDPAPIHAAMRGIGAEPGSTWVIGDGVQDMRAGRAAGCKTAAVLGGFTSEERLRREGPDVVLSSLTEFHLLIAETS